MITLHFIASGLFFISLIFYIIASEKIKNRQSDIIKKQQDLIAEQKKFLEDIKKEINNINK